MHRVRVTKLLACAAMLAALSVSAAGAAPIDSINGADNPDGQFAWAVPNIGWFYTPTFSYDLTAIGTKFGSSGQSLATAEIFSGAPGQSNFALLGAGTFTPVANTFEDAAVGLVALTAGTTYFVGFENIAPAGGGILGNVTNVGGATKLLPGVFFGGGLHGFANGPDADRDDFTQPILEFQGIRAAAAAPEPASLVLFGIGLFGLGALRRRRG